MSTSPARRASRSALTKTPVPPRVASGAALTVDPLDEAAISDALRQVLEDGPGSERLRSEGLARAAGYSWRHTADLLVSSWGHALAGG